MGLIDKVGGRVACLQPGVALLFDVSLRSRLSRRAAVDLMAILPPRGTTVPGVASPEHPGRHALGNARRERGLTAAEQTTRQDWAGAWRYSFGAQEGRDGHCARTGHETLPPAEALESRPGFTSAGLLEKVWGNVTA